MGVIRNSARKCSTSNVLAILKYLMRKLCYRTYIKYV